jgi:hypothetical protein
MRDNLLALTHFAMSVRRQHRRWSRALLYGVFVVGAAWSPLALAQAPSSCGPLLAEAEVHYVGLKFAEAEGLLRMCLAEPDLRDEEAVQAYRLLALVHLRQDELSEATGAVLRLLSVSLSYTADPVQDPPVYVALVSAVRDQLRIDGELPSPRTGVVEPEIQIVRTTPEATEEATPRAERVAAQANGLPRWLLIGGGVVAAGVAGVLLLSGGSSSSPPGGTPLPPPPSFPR